MTARDRTVLIVVGLLALLGGFWFLAISPKRKEASDVTAKVAVAQTRLDAAQASAASADAARKQYSTDYATVARLGKAVPVDDDMPSLVYQLSHTAKVNHVDFRAIKLTSTGGAAAAPTGAAAAVASANGNTSAPARPPRRPSRRRFRPVRPSAPRASRRCRSPSTSPARSSTCSAS